MPGDSTPGAAAGPLRARAEHEPKVRALQRLSSQARRVSIHWRRPFSEKRMLSVPKRSSAKAAAPLITDARGGHSR